MYKTFKEIREDDTNRKAVVTQGRIVSARTTDQSRVKDTNFDKHDSKRIQTNLAGKQKEPNRGEGAARHPAIAHPHRTGPTNEETIFEKAEATRFHPTHKLVNNFTGHEIKLGSSTKTNLGVMHIVDKLEPSRFGGAADRVITHKAGDPTQWGSFHPKDIGATMVRRNVKEGRESEFRANKELAPKKEKPKDNAYHDWAASKKKKLKEDIGMAAGAAGDPGHVQNPNDNYASQQRRKTFGMLRRQYKAQDKKRRDKVNAWHNRYEN